MAGLLFDLEGFGQTVVLSESILFIFWRCKTVGMSQLLYFFNNNRTLRNILIHFIGLFNELMQTQREHLQSLVIDLIITDFTDVNLMV